jgi:hypothetical protein
MAGITAVMLLGVPRAALGVAGALEAACLRDRVACAEVEITALRIEVRQLQSAMRVERGEAAFLRARGAAGGVRRIPIN